ncbi:hypothetical protein PS6_004712 [Mucor atramentarius]
MGSDASLWVVGTTCKSLIVVLRRRFSSSLDQNISSKHKVVLKDIRCRIYYCELFIKQQMGMNMDPTGCCKKSSVKFY